MSALYRWLSVQGAVAALVLTLGGPFAARTQAQPLPTPLPTPVPPPSAWSSGPSVSSMGPGRYHIFARSGGNFWVRDTTQFAGSGTTSTGWRVVPGVADLVSDPDSAVDPWKQFLVGRRAANNGCYFTTRGIPASGSVYPAWSAWTQCTPTAMTFDSGISVAISLHPSAPMSFVNFFGRRGGSIYWAKLTYYNNALVATQDWLFLATPVDDGSLPVGGTPTDFVGDPDATLYSNTGRGIAVCGQRASGLVYCSNFDFGPSPWHVMGPAKPGTGPGTTVDFTGQGYEVYYDLPAGGVGYRPWLNGWTGTFTLPAMAPQPVTFDQPYAPVTSDPDAAVYTDLVQNAPTRVVCARDAFSRIACTFWLGSNFSQWLLQR